MSQLIGVYSVGDDSPASEERVYVNIMGKGLSITHTAQPSLKAACQNVGYEAPFILYYFKKCGSGKNGPNITQIVSTFLLAS